jgi:hypothetical protein
VSIALPRTNGCSVGAAVHLQEQQRLWGPSFMLDWLACGGKR